MPLHSWRRLHGAHIVAKVDPDPFGMWDATVAASDKGPAAMVRLKQRYQLLTRAQAAADHAARKRFNHTCEVGTCGAWLPWESE